MSQSKNFYEKEEVCRILFSEASPCWHMNTPENFPVIFTCEKDYHAIMAITGICALMNPCLKIYSFEVMSNHLHLVIGGEEAYANKLFEDIKRMLTAYCKSEGKDIVLLNWDKKLYIIDTLDYFRAAVAYTHRNAYVVYPQYTPENYPWGTNRFYFNDEIVKLHRSLMTNLYMKKKREIIRSHCADHLVGPGVVNDCVSPVSFCHIEEAEMMFRDARHYFSVIAKEIESQKDIAKSIGETMFCTDEELFKIVAARCNRDLKKDKIIELTNEEKIKLALTMHRDYNASNKQICRILRMDATIVNELFPFRAKER